MIKKIVLVILLSPALAFATLSDEGPSIEKVVATKNALSRFLFTAKGVVAFGPNFCEINTGRLIQHEEYETTTVVNCLHIITSNQETFDAFMKLFPLGTKYKGIYLVFENAGEAPHF